MTALSQAHLRYCILALVNSEKEGVTLDQVAKAVKPFDPSHRCGPLLQELQATRHIRATGGEGRFRLSKHAEDQLWQLASTYRLPRGMDLVSGCVRVTQTTSTRPAAKRTRSPRASGERAAVIRFLEDEGRPVTSEEISTGIGWQKSPPMLRNLLQYMVNSGAIVASGRTRSRRYRACGVTSADTGVAASPPSPKPSNTALAKPADGSSADLEAMQREYETAVQALSILGKLLRQARKEARR